MYIQINLHNNSITMRLRGRVTFLATFCFVSPPYEVAMPSETNSTKERQNVRNARSRALRALVTPEEKLVRREIRNEKDREEES